MKKNFSCDQKVIFVGTGSSIIEGKFGTVIGKACVNITDIYIVLLDEPVTAEEFLHKAVVMTEACLEAI